MYVSGLTNSQLRGETLDPFPTQSVVGEH